MEDSLNMKEVSQKLQAMEFDKKLLTDSLKQVAEQRIVEEQFQEEVRRKTRTRNILVVVSAFILLLAIGLWSRLSYIRKSKSIIEKEKNRSESLLLNILPAELKEKGKADARDFEMV